MKIIIWLCILNFFFFLKYANPWNLDIKPKLYIKYDNEKTPIFFGNTSDYFKILNKDDNNLLIGAKNTVYNISVNGLLENTKYRIEWHSSEAHRELCGLKGKSDTDCQNYIRIFTRISDSKIMICGTNSFKPLCRFYNILLNSIEMDREIEAQGICPYDPQHNSTYIYTDGQLYSATVADFSGGDHLIYRETLRTEPYDLKQLNQPAFVNAVERNGYVFFFFRETAMEFMNCGKIIYSRVGRVCKNDKGGPYRPNERWTSFLKARLNCSLPGEFPFYFDEIQATTQIIDREYNGEKNSLIYAVMNTPVNAIGGSAICIFTLSSILKAFEGPFKAQKDINSNWLPVPIDNVPDPRPGQCVDDSRTLPSNSVNFAKTHTLMESAITSLYNKPIFTRVSLTYRFTSITVDPQINATDGEKYNVIFVGTDQGVVIKLINYINLTDSMVTNVISEVQTLPDGTAVKELSVSKATFSLIVVGNGYVVSVPLFDCSKITRCNDCVLIQDPYCVWDIKNHECKSIYDIQSSPEQYMQDIQNPNSKICKKYEENENSLNNPHDSIYMINSLHSSHGTVSAVGRAPHIESKIQVNSIDSLEQNNNYPYSDPVSNPPRMNLSTLTWIVGSLALVILGILIGFFIAKFYAQKHSFDNGNPLSWHNTPSVGSTILGRTGSLTKSRHMVPPRDKDINLLMNVSQYSMTPCHSKIDNLEHDFIGLVGKDRSSERKNSTESINKEVIKTGLSNTSSSPSQSNNYINNTPNNCSNINTAANNIINNVNNINSTNNNINNNNYNNNNNNNINNNNNTNTNTNIINNNNNNNSNSNNNVSISNSNNTNSNINSNNNNLNNLNSNNNHIALGSTNITNTGTLQKVKKTYL